MLTQLTAIADQLEALFNQEQNLTRDSVFQGAFEQFAIRLFEMQYALNLPYQALCRSRSIRPENIQHWADIPSVSTSAFKDFAFTCLPEENRTYYFESSGTTRQRRSRNYHSGKSLQLYKASLLPWFKRQVVPWTAKPTANHQSSCSFISLTPNKNQAPHSSLVYMLDTVSQQEWFYERAFVGQCEADQGWLLTPQSIQVLLRQLSASNRPVVIAGTAFNFVHLLDQLNQSNTSLRLPAGSRIMETGGYKGRSRELSRPDLHAELSRRMGIPSASIITEYGMCELGSQAYSRGTGATTHEQNLQFPPWVQAVVTSPETGQEVDVGQVGLVRIVDLANAYSVISIETEDLAIRRNDGFELLGRKPRSENRGCSLMATTS